VEAPEADQRIETVVLGVVAGTSALHTISLFFAGISPSKIGLSVFPIAPI
jgi:hypothetical protein